MIELRSSGYICVLLSLESNKSTRQPRAFISFLVFGNPDETLAKLTVFLELRSRKTVRFSKQTMSADKYSCIFSRQMETIVYISPEFIHTPFDTIKNLRVKPGLDDKLTIPITEQVICFIFQVALRKFHRKRIHNKFSFKLSLLTTYAKGLKM